MHDALAPHFERYGIFLVAPTVFAAALLIPSLLPDVSSPRLVVFERRTLALLGVLGLGWLGIFQSQYLAPLAQDGGHSHLTFRTARGEPKVRALESILRELEPSPTQPTRIVAEDWWLEQPLTFLASGRPDLEVVGTKAWPIAPEARQREVRAALAEGAYLVGFADGHLEADIRAGVSPRSVRRSAVRDPDGKPLIVVYRDRLSTLARVSGDRILR